MISIVIPTIAGREATLARCVDAYENRTEDEFEIIIVKGKPTCGIAWQEGAEKAQGLYLHFSADDLEPALGWDIHARECADEGDLPAPYIYHGATRELETVGVTPDGFFTRIPFCTMEQWAKIGPMIPIHYYTDNWFSWRGNAAGYETCEVASYAFLHHWEQHGRYHSDKMIADHQAYWRYKRDGYRG